MAVEIRLFATVREAVGQRTLTRECEPGTTVRDLLAALEAEYPSLEGQLLDGAEVAGGITVLRNGTHVTHFAGTETVLSDGDSLSITPPVTGGSLGSSGRSSGPERGTDVQPRPTRQ